MLFLCCAFACMNIVAGATPASQHRMSGNKEYPLPESLYPVQTDTGRMVVGGVIEYRPARWILSLLQENAMYTIKFPAIAILIFALSGCSSQPVTSKSTTSPSTATADSTAANVKKVKSEDGSFDGVIIGTPAPASKFAKLRIGMTQRQVEDLIGRPDDEDSHITGKAFIPFFFGGDTHRLEAFYKNEGQLTYSPTHFGGNANVLMRIQVNTQATGMR